MKKLLVLIASLSLVLAACSSDKENATETKTTGATSTEEKANPAADMMNFYLSVSQSINEVDADLNAFEDAQAAGELPEGAELQTMKDNAKAATVNASAKVKTLKIPASLTEQQEAIEGALAKIQDAYNMKSEALAAEGEYVAEEANAKFQEADTELNAVLKEVGLIGSSIFNEVSL